MSKLHTSIAQWGLVSGIRQDASDLIVVAPFPSQFSPEARKGQLIVVVEAEGDVSRGRNACTLVANTIQETFYGDRAVSITSSLRKALKAANAALYQFNFESPSHKRATVGVTCAVIHGAHLFVAQVHPAQAYVVHAGKLRALPNPLAWSGGAQGGAAVGHSTALGTSLGSEPEFYREVLQAGDTVVLTASNVARILGKAQAEQLLTFGDAPAIADGLYELCRRNHLPESHAIAVEMTPELSAAAREAPLSAAGVGERGKLAVEHLSGWVASRVGRRQEESGDTAPDAGTPDATDWTEYEQHPLAIQSSALHSREATAPVAAQTSVAVPGVVPGSLLDRVPVGDPDVVPLSAFLGEGDYGGIVRPPAIKRERQIDLGDNTGTPMDFAALPRKAQHPPAGMVEQATMPLRSAVVHMLGGMANRRRRTTMDVQPRAPRTKVRGLSYRRERPPFPWANLVVLLVAVVLIAGVGIQLNRNQDQAIVNRAFGAVETAVAAAENATDDTDAQQRLIDAERALNDLDTLKTNGQLTPEKTAVWESYQQLLLRYDQARSSINRIGVLSDLAPLVTLPSPNGLVSRVVLGVDTNTVGALQEDRLYVLDRGSDSGVLYERAPDGTLTPLLSPGQDIGGSINAGPIRDVLWRGDNPMALDRDDNPFNAFATSFLRNGDGWLANRLNGTELMPLGDVPATSYGGNLYLWDSEKQQLMRYASGQYGDLPTEWITNRGDADLSNVVGIQIDGNVNLLRGDGSVVIFTDGAYQRTLPPPTLTPPVKNITRFFVTPDQIDAASGTVVAPGSIFLLDTLNERVIETRKEDGSEVQQIVARDTGQLSQLADLQVDIINRQIYLANGNEVYRARLPNPPAN